MNSIYLGIGGNLGDRMMNLQNTCHLIEKNIGAIQKKSMIYVTEPWGFDDEDDFYNQAILVFTKFNLRELYKRIEKIESLLGRGRHTDNTYESRTTDIDILFFNQEIIDLQDLNLFIPHPKLHLRNFVLIPMNEIASDYIHPVFNKTIKQLSVECIDDKLVKKLSP